MNNYPPKLSYCFNPLFQSQYSIDKTIKIKAIIPENICKLTSKLSVNALTGYTAINNKGNNINEIKIFPVLILSMGFLVK